MAPFRSIRCQLAARNPGLTNPSNTIGFRMTRSCPGRESLPCEHSFTYLLVGLLLACPLLCRATDDGCCADDEVPDRSKGDEHAPGSSDGSTSCICGGAIKAAENRIHAPSAESLSPSDGPLLPDCILPHDFSPTLRHGSWRITARGTPAGEAPGPSTPSSSTSAADIPPAGMPG